MAFFYDNLSGLSSLAQYDRYLENNLYIRNLKKYTNDPLNYQLLEIKRTIGENISASIDNTNRLSRESQNHFENLTTAVCGTLEKGFEQVVGELEDINWRLNDINEGISGLHSMLDWKTDILIENQRITNLYLGKIVALLKIPDSQKQRAYYVDQGMNYLKNAIEEGPKSDFYTDAFEELSKAKNIEEKDFFCLHKLGLIHFSSINHLDIEKADIYFRASARYAKAAANVAKSVKEIGSNNEEVSFSKELLLEEAASALNYASRSNYIKLNFLEAIEFAREAFELQPNNPEYGFQLAKCLCANDQEEKATKILIKIIDMNKYYLLKIIADMDFIRKRNVIHFIEELTTNLIEKVKEEINTIRENIVSDSKAKNQFKNILKLFAQPTYINARSAKIELEKIQEWNISSYTYVSPLYYLQKSSIKETTSLQNLRIADFVFKEKAISKILSEFKEQERIDQAKEKEEVEARWKKMQETEKQKKIFFSIGIIIIGITIFYALSVIEGDEHVVATSLKVFTIGLMFYGFAKIFKLKI